MPASLNGQSVGHDTGLEQVESYRLTGERYFGYVLLHIG
jgi:hypothetical protein